MDSRIEQSTKIVAGMATIPERIDTLKMVLDSVVNQVDELILALNGFEKIPDWLYLYPNLEAHLTTNEKGDANKFLKVDEVDGYYFSMDDDIVYPKNYVQRYIKAIDSNRCLITIHGSDIPKRMIKSYYKGKKMRSHCLNNLNKAVFVDVAGSGVSGFHTSFLKLRYDDFRHPNMADIWLSKQCHEQGVNRLCIKHDAGWIRGGLNKGRSTIYESHKNNDSIQTKAVNDFNWR
jgi:hypothetical protein